MAEKYLNYDGVNYLWTKIKNTFTAKENGKGLSSNDYTSEEKLKLAGLNTGYIPPVNIQGVKITGNFVPYAALEIKTGKAVQVSSDLSSVYFNTAANYTTYRFELEANTEYCFSRTWCIAFLTADGTPLFATDENTYYTSLSTADYPEAKYCYYSTSTAITAESDVYFSTVENYRKQKADIEWLGANQFSEEEKNKLAALQVENIPPVNIAGVTMSGNLVPFAAVEIRQGKYVSVPSDLSKTVFGTNSNFTTYKIAVKADTVYYFSRTWCITLIDSDGTPLFATNSSVYYTSLDTGDYPTAAYCYYSTNTAVTPSDEVYFSENAVAFEPKADIPWISISDEISDGLDSISVKSVNLFNPAKVVNNKYITHEGTVSDNSSYCYLNDFVPVSQGENIYCSKSMRFVAAYDAELHALSAKGSSGWIGSGSAYSVPEGVSYIKITISKTTDNVMLNKGKALGTYQAYGGRLISGDSIISLAAEKVTGLDAEQCKSLLGKATSKVENASVGAGDSVEITAYPRSVKKNTGMTFYGEFTQFTGLSLGKGKTEYGGQYLEITPTQIISHFYDTSDHSGTPVNHSLTFDTFIYVNWYVDDAMKCYVKLTTLGGSFDTTFTWNGSQYGIPFFTPLSAMTDTILSMSCADFSAPMWMFGDSYFGMQYSTRVLYHLKSMGYMNFLAMGRPGMTPESAYLDLQRALNFGTPKFIVWCEGMNGSEADAISYMNLLKALCNTKNITLIVTKIPTVPERSKETLNTAIESSGLRFIDSYKAVGANSSGAWYTGYLSSDGVHPTTLGARAIAMRMLLDVPEIIIYGKNQEGEI